MNIKITQHSLFFKGGTILPDEIYPIYYINELLGYLAINDNYIFLQQHNELKAIKYKLNAEYMYKILKTHIKIISKERFIKFMTDKLFCCNAKNIFKHYFN